MTFQKLNFEEALSAGQLVVKSSGENLSHVIIASLKVGDLENNVKVTLFGDEVRLFRKAHRHLADSIRVEDREAIRLHPECIGHYWRGVSSSPIFPREPYLPESNALDFLRQVYEETLMTLNDEGKIMLD